MELHAPVERLAVDDEDEDQADGAAGEEPCGRAEKREKTAFSSEHAADLRLREPEVAQHSELAAPREDDCAEARREPEKPDEHRYRFHGVRHREAPIEDPQRGLADFAG